MRVNVVVALTFSAIVGGLVSGMSLTDAVSAFESGLGGGATIALSYAMLGTFAVAISKSGITDLLASSVIRKINGLNAESASTSLKHFILIASILVTMSSQNIIPVHIAFIPILIPPLLQVFAKFKLDRRLVACVLTFGLITPMVLPVGFGGIFLNNILLKNLHDNGLDVVASQVPMAMLLPASGMIFGLLMAIFVSYRKPREYNQLSVNSESSDVPEVKMKNIWIALAGIVMALAV
jgi:predicted histidine transporter YuiF (NhaC family)